MPGDAADVAGIDLSDALLRECIESLPHLMWSCGPDGRCDYLSPQWVAYTGRSAAMQLGYGWLDQLHPDDVEDTQRRWTAAAASGERYDAEFRVRRHDGEYRWFKTHARPLLNASGHIARWFGTSTDVQDLRDATESVARSNAELEARVDARTRELARVNAQLAASAAQLELAQSVARVGSWEYDILADRVTWSAELYRIMGLDPAQPPPRYATPRDGERGPLFDPESWTSLNAIVHRAVANGEGYSQRLDLRRSDGSTLVTIARAQTVRDAAGAAVRLIGTLQDVTEEDRTNRRLEQSEAQQRGILASAGSAIMATDADGTFTLFNRAAEELLGYSADDVIGKATPLLIHEPAEVALRSRLLEAELGRALAIPCDVFFEKARRGPPQTAEWTLLRKDGEPVPVLLTVNTLRDSANQIVGFLKVAVDLGPRKRQERELLELNRRLSEQSERAEAASRAKSMFLANMSHEMRTPLGAITGMSYLLGKTALSPEQREYMDALGRASQTLLGMISDVLDLAKIEAQQLNLESEPFSLGQLLDDLASLMSAYAAGKNLGLILDAEPDLPELVRGDRVRLLQVLTNLVGNAVKFTNAGFVRVSVRRVTDAAEATPEFQFDVEDSGAGIEPEVLERLFQPFSQGGRAAGGTGLGLAIVKQLVELMGGAVGVRSVPNAGSTFWFRAPLPVVPKRLVEPSRVPHALIVDDHDAQRLALMLCAKRLGWQVTGASSGDEALGLVAERVRCGRGFDTIVLDWKMPGRDGLATASALRDMMPDESPRPCLIMVTAFDLAALRAEAGSSLADALLSKPVTASALFDALAQARGDAQDMAQVESLATERLSGLTILVVDDSDVNRLVATRILQLQGARVEAASSGAEAIERVEALPRDFDVVLMDMQMPGLDGVATAKRLRQLGSELPIIALTAAALATERRRALEAGMSDFVTKPFDPQALVRCILRHARSHPGLARAQQPKPGRASEWPEIDGIEADDARARLGADATLLLRLLDGLLGEFGDLTTLDRTRDFSAVDLDALAGRLHKLRGSAGNLGARALQRAAADAEKVCRSVADGGARQPHEATLAALTAIARELVRLRTSAQGFLAEPAAERAIAAASPGQPAMAPPPSVEVERFALCLSQNDLEALAIFERIALPLRELLGTVRYRELSAALDRLDFPVALALMSGLPARIDAQRAS